MLLTTAANCFFFYCIHSKYNTTKCHEMPGISQTAMQFTIVKNYNKSLKISTSDSGLSLILIQGCVKSTKKLNKTLYILKT